MSLYCKKCGETDDRLVAWELLRAMGCFVSGAAGDNCNQGGKHIFVEKKPLSASPGAGEGGK